MADQAAPFSSARSLITIGAGAFVLFLVATLPARLAIGWFSPDSVRAAGVEGSLWSGSAAGIVAGDVRLGATRWSARPASLLAARAGFHLETAYAGGTIIGNAAFGFGNSIVLDDVTGVLPMAGLENLITGLPPIGGRIGLSIESARLDKGWPTHASGTVDLIDVAVVAPARYDLGTFQVVFDGDSSDPVTAQIADVQSPLGVRGELNLRNDRSYDLNVNVSPDPADTELVEALTFMTGPPGPDGHRLSRSGTL